MLSRTCPSVQRWLMPILTACIFPLQSFDIAVHHYTRPSSSQAVAVTRSSVDAQRQDLTDRHIVGSDHQRADFPCCADAIPLHHRATGSASWRPVADMLRYAAGLLAISHGWTVCNARGMDVRSIDVMSVSKITCTSP
jgi:hypothetical protein